MRADPAMPITISISRRTILMVFAIIAIVWAAMHLVTVLVVVFSAIVLATAVDPPVSWMQAHRIPRAVGVLTIIAALVLMFVGVAVLIVPILGDELQALQSDIPRYVDQVQRFLDRVAPRSSATSVDMSKVSQQLTAHLQSIAIELTQLSLLVGRVAVLMIATMVITIFIAINPAMGITLMQRFAPPSFHKRAITISTAIRLHIGAWARGQALMATTFGLAMGIGLSVLDVPYAVSLAVVAAVLEAVPYLGGAVTLALAIPLALIAGPIHAAGVIILYIVLVNLETHVLAPIFFGKTVDLPPVAVLVALLIGVESAGILGAVMAIPATVIVWAVVEELRPLPPPPGAAPGAPPNEALEQGLPESVDPDARA